MAKLQKIKLKSKMEGYAYYDNYGVINCAPEEIYLDDANTGKGYTRNDLYIKKGDNSYEYVSASDMLKFTDFDKVAKNPPYIMKENFRSRYYRQYQFSDEMFQQIALTKIYIKYRAFAVELTRDNKNALDMEVWSCEGYEGKSRPVEFYRLKEGMRVYYKGKGTCTVEKAFTLMPELCACHIKTLSGGETIAVSSDDVNIYYLPYDEPEHYLKQFNDRINEPALRPRVDWYSDAGYHTGIYRRSFNVYWLPVENAVRYTVSLYRHYENGNNVRKNVLYKLKDYIVERNDCMLTVDKLFGGNYIVRVSAENRNGEIIAMSRGIKDNEPEWWNE